MAWYAVIDRTKYPDYDDMPSITYGPFATEVEVQAEVESDSSVVYALITIDAKNEGWNCDDITWTQDPPESAEQIIRTRAEVQQELESALDWGDAPEGLVDALRDALAGELPLDGEEA